MRMDLHASKENKDKMRGKYVKNGCLLEVETKKEENQLSS